MYAYKFVVELAPGKMSFYDPESKCNLFMNHRVFGFDMDPTPNILMAMRTGTLIDVNGNIKDNITGGPSSAPTIRYDPNKNISLGDTILSMLPEDLIETLTQILQALSEQDIDGILSGMHQ